MSLTEEGGLRAYATMMNTLDASCLESLLADDFHYASQWRRPPAFEWRFGLESDPG